MEDGLIKKLLASIKCSVCGRHYEAGNVSILGHRQDMWYLRAQCPACHAHSLVTAVVKEDRLPEPVTDLSEREQRKFKDARVTADDVLDMHNALKDFGGDLTELLNES